MKVTDFTLAWMQKFDFDGKPYKFSKIDLGISEDITASTFQRFDTYTNEQLSNVMVILSDSLCLKGSSYITKLFEEGEIVYLSTLIAVLGERRCNFGRQGESVYSDWTVSTQSELGHFISKRAGTFYIFDFNDNPV